MSYKTEIPGSMEDRSRDLGWLRPEDGHGLGVFRHGVGHSSRGHSVLVYSQEHVEVKLSLGQTRVAFSLRDRAEAQELPIAVSRVSIIGHASSSHPQPVDEASSKETTT